MAKTGPKKNTFKIVLSCCCCCCYGWRNNRNNTKKYTKELDNKVIFTSILSAHKTEIRKYGWILRQSRAPLRRQRRLNDCVLRR